jgi:tetratricopeptide (TPR) repeat protein
LWRYGREVVEGVRATGTGPERYWLAASAGGVAAILFDSLFNFQFSVPPTLILLFTLLAFPAALARARARESNSGRRAEAPENSIPAWARSRGSLPAARALLTLILLAAAGAFARWTLRSAQAERDYKAALDFERNGNLAAAERACREGLALDTLNGRLRFGLARALYSARRFPEALAETLGAERTYRDSHIEVLKARILDEMRAVSLALVTYRHALALDPTLKTVQADIQRLEASGLAP